MIQASKETLQTALTNNSFDLDMTEKIIRMAQDNSYQYLFSYLYYFLMNLNQSSYISPIKLYMFFFIISILFVIIIHLDTIC